MNPVPRLCIVWRISRGFERKFPKYCAAKSSNGSRTRRRTTRSVLMFTTAGKTFATASTAGSDAGSACPKTGAGATAKRPANESIRHWRNVIGEGEVTGVLSHCQLARSSDDGRLNEPCVHRLRLI